MNDEKPLFTKDEILEIIDEVENEKIMDPITGVQIPKRMISALSALQIILHGYKIEISASHEDGAIFVKVENSSYIAEFDILTVKKIKELLGG